MINLVLITADMFENVNKETPVHPFYKGRFIDAN